MVLISWIFERQLALCAHALRGYRNISITKEFNNTRFRHTHLPPVYLRNKISISIEKYPSANHLNVTFPYTEFENYFSQLKPKRGIYLMIVLARIVPNWLIEITKFIDFNDRKTIQLRCFYAHAGVTYSNVNAERITSANDHLLKCGKDGSPSIICVLRLISFHLYLRLLSHFVYSLRT